MISIGNASLSKFIDFSEINDLHQIFDQLRDLEKIASTLPLNELQTLIEYKYLQAEYNLRLGRLETAFLAFDEVKSLSIVPDHLAFYFLAQIGRARVKFDQAKYYEALNYIEESEYFFSQLDSELIHVISEYLSIVFHLKGEVYSQLGDMDSALDYFEKSLSYGNMEGDQIHISDNLLSIGHVYRKQGDLTNASNYYQQALKYYRVLNKRQKEAQVLNHIAIIHRIRGDITQARENLENSIQLYRKYRNERSIVDPLENLGFVTAIEGDLAIGYEMLLNTLDRRRRFGNSEEIGVAIFYLIRVAMAMKRIDEIPPLLEEFDHLVKSNQQNLILITYWKLTNALVLKNGGRLKDIVEAQDILQEILASGIVNHELMVITTVNLCEILIYELSFNEDSETFEEAKMLVNSILKIAQQQNSITLLIEGFIIKSKFAILEGDTHLANHLLIQAKINAEERGLGNQIRKISEEQEALELLIEKWVEMSQQSISISEKIQESRLLDYIRELHKL